MKKQEHPLTTPLVDLYAETAAVIVAASPVVTIPAELPGPIIITLPTEYPTPETLSGFLRLGRQYHPLCRNAFVQRVQLGYYAYERREEWHTSALAAAYAGAFGPQSVERPDFSYSQAVWRLSQRVGFDISQRMVYGPTGRFQPVDREMIQLVVDDGWFRDGVADWLESQGL